MIKNNNVTKEESLVGGERIYQLLKNAITVDDFITVNCRISDLFSSISKEEIDILKKHNFHIHVIEYAFRNKTFIKSLHEVIEAYRSFKKGYEGEAFFIDFRKENVECKKIIYSALATATSALAAISPSLKDPELKTAAIFLRRELLSIKQIPNNRYTSEEIFHSLEKVFHKDFFITEKRLKLKNFNHYASQAQTSSFIISGVIDRFYRNKLLCSIFKTIENDKLAGKFSTKTIMNLSRFIFEKRESEIVTLRRLKALNGTTNYFMLFENIETDNETNSFNLIDITLSYFQTFIPNEIALYKERAKKIISQELWNLEKQALLGTITDSVNIKKKLDVYAVDNFKAFSSQISLEDIEWSNKLFIACSRLIGTLISISNALDENWKFDVAMNEFYKWVSDVHEILNKYEIEDDWNKINTFLDQETDKIEWKSTFFTPTEELKKGDTPIETSKKIFYGIIKTILAMMNTDGGVILVGLVENPEQIVINEIKSNLLEKNRKYFIDISDELKINGMDLDSLKRKIQDSLMKEAMLSTDNFNNLWKLETIQIRSVDGKKEITIFKIQVYKSEIPIFSGKSQKEEDLLIQTENIWISLLRRADGRTIRVDPRSFL